MRNTHTKTPEKPKRNTEVTFHNRQYIFVPLPLPVYAWVSAVATSRALTMPCRHARADHVALATNRAASGVSAADQRAFASRTDGLIVFPPLSTTFDCCSAGGAKDVNGQGGTDTANWNSFEGGADKPLTPAEKKAKNAKEDAESKARRAASAKQMAEEAAAKK